MKPLGEKGVQTKYPSGFVVSIRRVMEKEYEVWTRRKDGSLRRSGRAYDNYDECKRWYDYLCTTWREEFKAEVEKEDLNKTNWATMSWNEKKDDKFLIVKREVGPYSTIEEEE